MWEEDRQLRVRGFTREQENTALLIQRMYRGKLMRENFKMMVKGKKIMRTAEEQYLAHPDEITNLCNYMLWLHAVNPY